MDEYTQLPVELFVLMLDVLDRGTDYIKLHKALRLTCKAICGCLPKPPPLLRRSVLLTVQKWRECKKTHNVHHECPQYLSLHIKRFGKNNSEVWVWRRPLDKRPCCVCGVRNREQYTSLCQWCYCTRN
jgi:hypothetical protein